MKPLAQMPADVCKRIETIFTDIDDTVTTESLIPRDAFSALWDARDAGLRVVLVTGRPAGWCDHFARMWPVAAVVGENGALAFRVHEHKMERLYADRPADAQEKLDVIRAQVLRDVPGAIVATDQAYREYDLAIDFCEEVSPALDDAAVDRIAEIFREHGATAKVSSIHVNGWYGEFDKLTMCKRAHQDFFGAPLAPDSATYVGDSPNDEPMFAHFPHACGVANVVDMKDRMQALPAYLAPSRGGAGFAEVVAHVLKHR